MKRKPVIAIDGYSSTGKSSISKIIANRLGIIHMDTGALYRGVTLYAIENHFDGEKILLDALFDDLKNIRLEFRKLGAELVLYLNDKEVSAEIRSPEVANLVSLVASQPQIRSFLLNAQRNIAKNGGVILDGRDIGTVVLPDADYKFFLTASVEERTRRRHAELLQMGQNTTPEAVRENLLLRDKLDSEREVAPLRQAEDAILIDNSNLNKEETVALILSYIKE